MTSGLCKEKRDWKSLKIDDKLYMICYNQKNELWNVLLTNLIEIWIGVFTDKIMFRKCQVSNPLLNVSEFNWKQSLMDMLNDIPKYIVEASPDQIKLQKNCDFIKFKLSLELYKGTPQQFWEYVTMSLCLSSMELIRQHRISQMIISEKNEEIAEYRAGASELLIKSIDAKPPIEESFPISTTVPTATDFVETFQLMLNCYNNNLINLPKVEVEQELMHSDNESTNETDTQKEFTQDTADPICNSKRSYDDIAPIHENTLSCDINRQLCSKNKEYKNEIHSSASKTSSQRSTSHLVQKSFKKSKKTLNDLIL